MNKKEYSIDFGGEKLSVEISDLVEQANGSALVRYGETTIKTHKLHGKHNHLRNGAGR